MSKFISKTVSNLSLLAGGNTGFDLEIPPACDQTEELRKNFLKINDQLKLAKEAIDSMIDESKTTAARISRLIDKIKNESDVTTRSMETSYNEISEAIASVGKTIESLNCIVNLANEASVGVIEIAKASVMGSMEQTTGMNRENMEWIIRVASLSEDVSASIEEIGMGIAELSDMAKILRNILEEYRF